MKSFKFLSVAKLDILILWQWVRAKYAVLFFFLTWLQRILMDTKTIVYMNGFQCDVTGARIDAPALSKPKVARRLDIFNLLNFCQQYSLYRRCGADPEHGVPYATPSNCTKGAKQPLYWFQKERNNVRDCLERHSVDR